MKILWAKVGFTPTSFELDESHEELEDDGIHLIRETNFPPSINRPMPTERDMDLYDSIIVKNVPAKVTDNEIIEFLKFKGVAKNHSRDDFKINRGDRNSNIVVEGIPNERINDIIKSVNFPDIKEKFFDSPLYCKAIRRMTPEKSLNKPTKSLNMLNTEESSPKSVVSNSQPTCDKIVSKFREIIG